MPRCLLLWPASTWHHTALPTPSLSPRPARPDCAQRELAAALPEGVLHTHHRFLRYTEGPEGVVAEFETPEGTRQVAAQLLLGCDGGQSAVREAMLADGPPTYLGLAIWRAARPKPDSWSESYASFGGVGQNLITTDLGDGKMVWQASTAAVACARPARLPFVHCRRRQQQLLTGTLHVCMLHAAGLCALAQGAAGGDWRRAQGVRVGRKGGTHCRQRRQPGGGRAGGAGGSAGAGAGGV